MEETGSGKRFTTAAAVTEVTEGAEKITEVLQKNLKKLRRL